MSSQPRVLLVFKTATIGKLFFGWFSKAGYEVALVTSFAGAKVQLQSGIDLLVSEIRLGEYNGLHLASRAHAHHIPAVVLGESDVVLERDAQQMGVAYVPFDVDRKYLLMLASHLTAERDSEATESTPFRPSADANLAFVSSGDLVAEGVRVGKRHSGGPLLRRTMN